MDYSKILKIDENTTIVDVIGIYEVFLKRKEEKTKRYWYKWNKCVKYSFNDGMQF